MEIVIEIPEEDYNFVKKQVADGIFNPLKVRIANGTPLPKGHGRLIDAKAYEQDIRKHYFDNELVIRCTEITLDNAPTIIEADKENQICN